MSDPVILDTATVLNDLARAALDDCRIHTPLATRRLIDRMTELPDIAGITITRDDP